MDQNSVRPARLLRGAIDTHIHTAPDVFERSVDDIEAATQAKNAHMKAIAIKNHHTMTCDRAYIASRVAGFPVFGGITLNYWVGGLNKFAVEAALHLGARTVWMPTITSRHYMQNPSIQMFTGELPVGFPGITVLTRQGDLLPELPPILELIAEKDVALGTGHLSPEEAKILVEEARQLGVRKITVQHPQADFIGYTLDDMKAIVERGAILEHHYSLCTQIVRPESRISLVEMADSIKEVGAENCIMATDGGQKANPEPVQMLGMFVEAMQEYLSEKEIRVMIEHNPMKILGIE